MAVFFSVRLAAAQSQQRVSLIYETDPDLEDCPSNAEFVESVATQLGYDPFVDDAPRTVLAVASLTPSGVTGTLLWRDAEGQPRGERQLVAEHQDCAELARSMAFAIVVQLQLLDAPPPQPGPPETPPEKDPPIPIDEPDPVEPPKAPERDEQARRWQLQIGVGPAAALGLAPEPTLLGRLFAELRYKDFSVELGGAASWTTSVSTQDGNGLDSRVAFATLAPCYHYGPFAGCASTHAGRLYARGTGIDAPREGSGFLAGVGGRLGVSQPLGPLVASLHLDGLYSLTQWTVRLNDEAVWTTPDAAFLLGVDVAWPLPLAH